MNGFTRIIAVLLVVAALTAGAFALIPAKADTEAKSVTIAVVDIQQLLKESKAAQDIEGQLKGIRKDFQTELEKKEKALRDDEKSILAQKGKISEDEFKKKVQSFQQKVAESQKSVQERKASLDKALADALGKLRAEIVKVVAEIGEKKGLDIVISRADVVIVSKEMDITADVLKQIDSDLPSVKVSVK